jgi:hypothetical protein
MGQAKPAIWVKQNLQSRSLFAVARYAGVIVCAIGRTPQAYRRLTVCGTLASQALCCRPLRGLNCAHAILILGLTPQVVPQTDSLR